MTTNATNAAGATARTRVRVDGKFFRAGAEKFFIKGVTYGPFAPGPDQSHLPSQVQAARDFELIRALGANTVRIYHPPPRWLADLAQEFGLRLLVDIPWSHHLCFLDSPQRLQEARDVVRQTVAALAGHPAILAYSVANEIPPDIVRWFGPRRVAAFLEELVDVAKAADPGCLCTFTNFPPTEYLRPRNLDFHCFNVYLHQPRAFDNYLARLQMIADLKPLVLGEFGMDSLREGEAQKSAMLAWQIETAFRNGLAGAVVFSFTDDWWRAGRPVEDWTMGLTTRERVPKPSFETVRTAFQQAPYFPLPQTPKVSVVVASYNGARTLKACLDSLQTLHYPNYEVILVDDGSTDTTPHLAAQYPSVLYIRQTNQGLSAARNTGIAVATGEIIAFTDSDCRADEDWLYYLVGDLLRGQFAGIGGHNFLPPEDSLVAAAVMASPGGPAHVMLTDRLAEHIPGCNMAFWKWALDAVGWFDPVFRKAGDDVDICWRLQQQGLQIGFSPAGFVWHYRRSTVEAYLKQQQGYGEAEALLIRKHPEYFNALGGSLWAGRIYTTAKLGVLAKREIVYHGIFGTGLFQTLYAPRPAFTLMLMTSFEYHMVVTLPLLLLSVPFQFLLPVAATSLLATLGICIAAACQAELPAHRQVWWSRPMVALLYLLQPIVRGWARYRQRLTYRPTPVNALEKLDSMALRDSGEPLEQTAYWAEHWVDRVDFLKGILHRLENEGWQHKPDNGWSDYDVEIYGSRWSRVQLTTVAEMFAGGRQLFRCRLRSSWSLPARVAFGAAVAFELLLITFVSPLFPYIWLLLLTLPALGWFFAQEQRNLQSLVHVFLDDVARQFGMIKLRIATGQPLVPPPAAPAPAGPAEARTTSAPVL